MDNVFKSTYEKMEECKRIMLYCNLNNLYSTEKEYKDKLINLCKEIVKNETKENEIEYHHPFTCKGDEMCIILDEDNHFHGARIIQIGELTIYRSTIDKGIQITTTYENRTLNIKPLDKNNINIESN